MQPQADEFAESAGGSGGPFSAGPDTGQVSTRRGTDAVAVTLMLFFAASGMSLSLIPVVADNLQTAFHYSDSQIGLLTSALLFAFGVVAIPSGLAAARWGGRVLAVGAVLYVIGSVLFALSSSYGLFVAARVIQGVGAGITVPACSAVMADLLLPKWRGRAWGIFGCGQGLGVVIALLVLPSVVHAGGYRAVFLATAGMDVAFGAAVFAQKALRARPVHAEGVPSLRSLGRALGTVAVNRRVLLLSLFNVAALGVMVGALAWTPKFMQTTFGASLGVSAYLTAGLGVAQLIGNPVGAAAMARWSKLLVIFVSMVLMTIVIALVPFVPGLAAVFVFVTLAGFLTMAYFSPLFAYIPEVVERPEQVGAATGIVEVFGFTGSLLTPWLFGLLLDNLGSHNGYIAGYLLLAAFGLFATVGIVFFKTANARAG
jgi:MFS family permease